MNSQDNKKNSKLNGSKIFIIILCSFLFCSIDTSLKYIGLSLGFLGTILFYGLLMLIIRKIYNSNIGQKSNVNASEPPTIIPDNKTEDTPYTQQIRSLQSKIKICIIFSVTSLIVAMIAIILPSTTQDKQLQEIAVLKEEVNEIQEKLINISKDLASHHARIGLTEIELEQTDLNELERRIYKLEKSIGSN